MAKNKSKKKRDRQPPDQPAQPAEVVDVIDDVVEDVAASRQPPALAEAPNLPPLTVLDGNAAAAPRVANRSDRDGLPTIDEVRVLRDACVESDQPPRQARLRRIGGLLLLGFGFVLLCLLLVRMQQLQGEKQQLQGEKQQLQGEIRDIKSREEDLEKQVRDKVAKLAELTKVRQQLAADLSGERSRHEETKKSLGKDSRQLADDIKQLTAEKDKVAKQLESQKRGLESERKRVEAEQARLAAELETAQAAVKSKDDLIEKAKHFRDQQLAEINRLKEAQTCTAHVYWWTAHRKDIYAAQAEIIQDLIRRAESDAKFQIRLYRSMEDQFRPVLPDPASGTMPKQYFEYKPLETIKPEAYLVQVVAQQMQAHEEQPNHVAILIAGADNATRRDTPLSRHGVLVIVTRRDLEGLAVEHLDTWKQLQQTEVNRGTTWEFVSGEIFDAEAPEADRQSAAWLTGHLMTRLLQNSRERRNPMP